jgi:hypothetical protein
MPERDKIRDIHSIKEVLDGSRNFGYLRKSLPFLKPLLRFFDVDVAKLEDVLGRAKQLGEEAEELARSFDRFNELFANRGWIAFERMSYDVMTLAVAKAEAGDWDSAEAELVEYFNAEKVRQDLMTMHAVEAFRPRMELAEKALDDYGAGRFHACVPIVLALLDGMVNEIHQKVHGTRRGISAEGVDLSAWDSIAAHSSGLNRLVKIFQVGRRKTTKEQITLPYRNGIMHGIDLGYDNKFVAAKTWAALFAAREWAVRAERGRLSAPPSRPTATLGETWQSLVASARRYSEVQAARERLSTWKPRQVQIGCDVPTSGLPESYAEGTPERKLVEYLSYWGKANFGFMARCIADVWGPPKNRAAADVRAEFADKRLISFEIVEFNEQAHSMAMITVGLTFTWRGKTAKVEHKFRMIYEGPDGMPALPEVGSAEWKVINWAVADPICGWEEEVPLAEPETDGG